VILVGVPPFTPFFCSLSPLSRVVPTLQGSSVGRCNIFSSAPQVFRHTWPLASYGKRGFKTLLLFLSDQLFALVPLSRRFLRDG